MHDFARLARFGDQRNLGSGLFPHQQIVNRGQGQQTRNGGVVFVHSPVGKNQQRISGSHGKRGSLAQLIQRAFQSRFSITSAEQRGQGRRQQIAIRNPAQLFQLSIGQQRMRQLEHVAVLRRLLEDVALASDIADERHHHFLANRIDRRIRNLREELLEIVEQ